jgi:hypothetical protein
MAQLAEAYIHLQPFYVSQERLQQLGRATDELVRAAAARFYGWPVEIEVDLIEGTLWGKIKVSGALAITGFTMYASIDGAINTTERLCKSANLFGDYVCSAFVKEAGAKKEQVARVEHRLKTPGKLRRALHRIKRLEETADRIGQADLQRELHRARLELEAVMKDLDSHEQEQLIEALKFEKLPPIDEWPRTSEMPRIARKPDDVQLTFQRDDGLIEHRSRMVVEKRKRLSYHNRFIVLPSARDAGSSQENPKRTS